MGVSFNLAGKVALVSGGSRGMGLEMSRALSDAGATVVVASRKLDACEAAAAEISSQTGGTVVGKALHAGRWDEVELTVDWIHDTFGRLDVVVNNAGLSPLYGKLFDVGEELFDKVIGVNLKGPFRMMAVAGPRMVAAGGGSIINISSIGSLRPSTHELPYSAAKNGLNALTKGFAQAYGPTVRVNCILPGAFATDMSAGWSPEMIATILDRLPAGRIGEASEIAGAVVYLASDASSYTTGALLTVDGGRTTLY